MRQPIQLNNRYHYEMQAFGDRFTLYDFTLQNANHPDSWKYTGNMTRGWKQWYPTRCLTTWWHSRSFTARNLKPFWVETKSLFARMRYDIHHGADDKFNAEDINNYKDKKNLAQMIKVKNAWLAREQRRDEISHQLTNLQNRITAITQALSAQTDHHHDPLQDNPTEQTVLAKIDALLNTCALFQDCEEDRSELLRIYNQYRALVARAAGVDAQKTALSAKLNSLAEQVSIQNDNLKNAILNSPGNVIQGIMGQVDQLHRRGLPDKAAPIGLLGGAYAAISIGICFALGPLGLPAAIISGIAFLTGAGSARAGLKHIGHAFWDGAWGNLIADEDKALEQGEAEKPNIKGLLALAGTYATVGAIIGSIVPGIGTLIGVAVGAAAGFALGAGTGIGVKNIFKATYAFIFPGLLVGLFRGISAGIQLPNRRDQTIKTFLKEELRSSHPSKLTHIGYLTGVATTATSLIIREAFCTVAGVIHGLFTGPISILMGKNVFGAWIDFWKGNNHEIAAEEADASDNNRFRSPLGIIGFALGSMISIIPAIPTAILKVLYLIGAAIKNDFVSLMSGIGSGISNGFKRGWDKATHQQRFSDERNALYAGQTANRAQWVGTWIGAPLPWIISGLLKGLLYRGWVSGIMNGYQFIANPKQTWQGLPEDPNAAYGIKDSLTKESIWTSTSFVISLPLGLIMTALRFTVDSVIGFAQRIMSLAYAGYLPNTEDARENLLETLTFGKDTSWIQSLSGIITTIPSALIGMIALTVRGIEDSLRGLLGSLPAYAQLGFAYDTNKEKLHNKAKAYRKTSPDNKNESSEDSNIERLKNPLIPPYDQTQSTTTMDRPVAYYASYLNPLGWITAGLSALVSGTLDGLHYGFNFGSHYLFSSNQDSTFGGAPNSSDIALNFMTQTPANDLLIDRKLPAKLLQTVIHTVGAIIGGAIAAPIGLSLRLFTDLFRGFVGSHALLFWCDPSNDENLEKAKEPFTNVAKGIGAGFAHLLALSTHLVARTTIVPLVNIFSGMIAGISWLGTTIFSPKDQTIYSTMRKATAWRQASELKDGDTPWKSPIGAATFFISSGLSMVICGLPFAGFKAISLGIDWMIEHEIPAKIDNFLTLSFKTIGSALYSFFIEGIRDGIQFGAKNGFFPGHRDYWQQAKEATSNNGWFSWPLGLAVGLATALPSLIVRMCIHDPIKGFLQGSFGPIFSRYKSSANYLDTAEQLLLSAFGFIEKGQAIAWEASSTKPIQVLFSLPGLLLSGVTLFTIDLITSTFMPMFDSFYNMRSENHSTLKNLKNSFLQSCGIVKDQPWQFKNIQPGKFIGTVLAAIPSLLATAILKLSAGLLETSFVHTAKRIWTGKTLSTQFEALQENYKNDHRSVSTIGAAIGRLLSYTFVGLYDLLLAGPALAISKIFQGVFDKHNYARSWSNTLSDLSGYIRGDHLGNLYRACSQRPLALLSYFISSAVVVIPTAIIAATCRFISYGLWNGITKGYNNSLAIGDAETWKQQSWLVKAPSYLIGGAIGLIGRIIHGIANAIKDFAKDKNPLEFLIVGVACLVVLPAFKVLTTAFKWVPGLSIPYQVAKLCKDWHNAGGYANLPSGTIGRRVLFGLPVINVVFKIMAKVSKQIAQSRLVSDDKTPLNGVVSFFASPKYQPAKSNTGQDEILTTLMKYLSKAQRGQVSMNGEDILRFHDNQALSTVSRVKHSLIHDEDVTRILKRIVNIVRNGRYTVDDQHQNRLTDGTRLYSNFLFNGSRQPILLKKAGGVELIIEGNTYQYNRNLNGNESLHIIPAQGAAPAPSAPLATLGVQS